LISIVLGVLACDSPLAVHMRLLPIQSALAVALAACLVSSTAIARTKSPLAPPEEERAPDVASMELSFEPAFFVGGNAPPRPGYFALFRLAGPLVGFDIGVLTNVGLPGDTIEPLGHSGAMLPPSKSQTSAFVFGGNFIHYSTEISHHGPNHLYLLAPEPDLRFIFSFADVPSSSSSRTSGGMILAPGVSAIGLRFTRYLGGNTSWVSELRGPTGFLYLPVMYGGDTSNPYGSIGFSIATGFVL
jgi:hypothetical protein